jgi:hypothetical protein
LLGRKLLFLIAQQAYAMSRIHAKISLQPLEKFLAPKILEAYFFSILLSTFLV